MTLREWMEAGDISQGEAGRRIGITQGHVSRLLRGLRRPGLELAMAIETATDGKVSAKDWKARGRRGRRHRGSVSRPSA